MTIVEGEGPGMLALPSFGFKIGPTNKFYFNVNFLSDMFAPLAVEAAYVFNDSYSKILIGTAKDWDENTFYSLRIDARVYRHFILKTNYLTRLQRNTQTLQFGVGYGFDWRMTP